MNGRVKRREEEGGQTWEEGGGQEERSLENGRGNLAPMVISKSQHLCCQLLVM